MEFQDITNSRCGCGYPNTKGLLQLLMDNCAVKCFVTWRPDGSTQTHPQLPVLLDVFTRTLGLEARDKSPFEPNQDGFHTRFLTSEQVQTIYRHLGAWPKFCSSISPPVLKISLKGSGNLAFLGCQMRGWNWSLGSFW